MVASPICIGHHASIDLDEEYILIPLHPLFLLFNDLLDVPRARLADHRSRKAEHRHTGVLPLRYHLLIKVVCLATTWLSPRLPRVSSSLLSSSSSSLPFSSSPSSSTPSPSSLPNSQGFPSSLPAAVISSSATAFVVAAPPLPSAAAAAAASSSSSSSPSSSSSSSLSENQLSKWIYNSPSQILHCFEEDVLLQVRMYVCMCICTYPGCVTHTMCVRLVAPCQFPCRARLARVFPFVSFRRLPSPVRCPIMLYILSSPLFSVASLPHPVLMIHVLIACFFRCYVR